MAILKKIKTKFTFNRGVYVTAKIGGETYNIEDLRDIAGRIGTEPNEYLDIAWPGQGYQHEEGKLLCDLKILESSGSIGGGLAAVSGPNCEKFSNEVFDYDRFDKLEQAMKDHLASLGLQESIELKEKDMNEAE